MTSAQLEGFAEPLRRFIEECHLDGRAQLADDAPLLEWGILDSLALADLMVFIEGRFGLTVPFEAVTPDNFRSLEAIASMLLALDADGG